MKKKIVFLLVLVLAMSMVACGGSGNEDVAEGDANNDIVATEESENVGERFTAEDEKFSICPPASWTGLDIAGMEYPGFSEPTKSAVDFAANMNFVLGEYDMTLDEFADDNITGVKAYFEDIEVGDKETLTAADGMEIIKTATTSTQQGMDLTQVFYFMSGDDERKMVITYSVLTSDADKYTDIFDESAVTFQWGK